MVKKTSSRPTTNTKSLQTLDAIPRGLFEGSHQKMGHGDASGPASDSSNPASMRAICGPTRAARKSPKGPSLTPDKFYQKIQESHYILSPNGDRPECYRHYEALGLGTVPLSQVDPVSFRHFEGSGLVFNNTVWRFETLMETLDSHPIVNRNLVLEEYWMECVDWTTPIEHCTGGRWNNTNRRL